MCSRKDNGDILKQLDRCKDPEEKRRILQQLNSCKTCTEKPDAVAQGKERCRCEEYHHIEFLNMIEHVKQHSGLKKSSENK